MANYAYYQNVPNWGTTNYTMTAPPVPVYQPLANWTGIDYYLAHGNGADASLYNYGISNYAGIGLSLGEAMALHQEVFTGIGDIRRMLPVEVGAAAAYEAWRYWQAYQSLGQPLGGSYARQRDALMAIAIADATQLWNYTARPTDTYGRLEAIASAAGTINRILNQNNLVMDATVSGMGSGLNAGMGGVSGMAAFGGLGGTMGAGFGSSLGGTPVGVTGGYGMGVRPRRFSSGGVSGYGYGTGLGGSANYGVSGGYGFGSGPYGSRRYGLGGRAYGGGLGGYGLRRSRSIGNFSSGYGGGSIGGYGGSRAYAGY